MSVCTQESNRTPFQRVWKGVITESNTDSTLKDGDFGIVGNMLLINHFNASQGDESSRFMGAGSKSVVTIRDSLTGIILLSFSGGGNCNSTNIAYGEWKGSDPYIIGSNVNLTSTNMDTYLKIGNLYTLVVESICKQEGTSETFTRKYTTQSTNVVSTYGLFSITNSGDMYISTKSTANVEELHKFFGNAAEVYVKVTDTLKGTRSFTFTTGGLCVNDIPNTAYWVGTKIYNKTESTNSIIPTDYFTNDAIYTFEITKINGNAITPSPTTGTPTNKIWLIIIVIVIIIIIGILIYTATKYYNTRR